MQNKLLAEAYKPAEKLAFNYLMLRAILNKLLSQQHFTPELDAALLKVYKNFQQNANKLISLYEKVPNVLGLGKLLDNIEDEAAGTLVDAGFTRGSLDTKTAVQALVKLIIDLEVSFLKDSEQYQGSIPGFNWDFKSFDKVFNQIEEKGLEYVQQSNNDEQVRSSEPEESTKQ